MEETPQMNRFMLVNVAAQRARQLMQGAEPLLRTKSRKPAAVAVKEVVRQLLPYYLPGEEPAETPAESEEQAEGETED